MSWLFNVTPWYDPKPTLNTTETLFVNVDWRMLMAVCSSWRKLLICAWVKNCPPLLKSLLTVICMVQFSLSHRKKGGDSAAASVAFAEFPSQLFAECHFLDNRKRMRRRSLKLACGA